LIGNWLWKRFEHLICNGCIGAPFDGEATRSVPEKTRPQALNHSLDRLRFILADLIFVQSTADA